MERERPIFLFLIDINVSGIMVESGCGVKQAQFSTFYRERIEGNGAVNRGRASVPFPCFSSFFDMEFSIGLIY